MRDTGRTVRSPWLANISVHLNSVLDAKNAGVTTMHAVYGKLQYDMARTGLSYKLHARANPVDMNDRPYVGSIPTNLLSALQYGCASPKLNLRLPQAFCLRSLGLVGREELAWGLQVLSLLTSLPKQPSQGIPLSTT